MTTYQKTIHDQLVEFGWELAGREDLGVWWADEAWKLRSAWSPPGLEVYLTFLVDPQTDVQRRKAAEGVWAVKASSILPVQWQKNGGEYVLNFGHGWIERLPELFSNLAQMRLKN